jgi:hypothetical protein
LEESVDFPKAQEICLTRRRFVGGANPRITMSADEAVLIRLRHEHNVQMTSQRGLEVISGNPRHTRRHAAKSSIAKAQYLRPIRGKYSRASHRQRLTAAKLTTFMTGFVKAYAILWQKLYARLSEHAFDQSNRVLGSRLATHLDIPDRVSMQTGRVCQVPDPRIRRSAPKSEFALVTGTKVHCATVTMSKTSFHVAEARGIP